MISAIIPTRDRPDELRATLGHLIRFVEGGLGGPGIDRENFEIIVVDNASTTEASAACEDITDGCGLNIRFIRLDENLGAAARNTGAQEANGDWLLMLDDDSVPLACDLHGVLGRAPADIAAIGGEIILPDGSHESGGMPEVIIGCGCAVRREAFLSVGGYDPSFGFYVEEYDLCAKLIVSGSRIVHTRALKFEHRKVTAGRNFSQILRRLVRNNAWYIARYAPDDAVEREHQAIVERYRGIAKKEAVLPGFERGMLEAASKMADQPRLALTDEQWSRLTGRGAVRRGLEALDDQSLDRVRLVHPGKGEDVIRSELAARGITIDERAESACIGTLSPGPVLDAMDAEPDAITLWSPQQPAVGQGAEVPVPMRNAG